jgi:FMN phosphatase YigB (HAD superfamily)
MSIESLLSRREAGRDILFDLDNTLYPEEAFLFAVFDRIGETHYGPLGPDVSAFLRDEFARDGRRGLFDKLLARHPRAGVGLGRLLETQRTFRSPGFLAPYPWFRRYCESAARPRKVRILTNGTPQQQRNKAASLDLAGLDLELEVACANALEPKPSARALELFRDFRSLRDPVYVGDDPVDREFARNCGIEFFDVAALKEPQGAAR